MVVSKSVAPNLSRRQAFFLARLFRAPKGQWTKVSILDHHPIIALEKRGLIEVDWGPVVSADLKVRPIYKGKKSLP